MTKQLGLIVVYLSERHIRVGQTSIDEFAGGQAQAIDIGQGAIAPSVLCSGVWRNGVKWDGVGWS